MPPDQYGFSGFLPTGTSLGVSSAPQYDRASSQIQASLSQLQELMHIAEEKQQAEQDAQHPLVQHALSQLLGGGDQGQPAPSGGMDMSGMNQPPPKPPSPGMPMPEPGNQGPNTPGTNSPMWPEYPRVLSITPNGAPPAMLQRPPEPVPEAYPPQPTQKGSRISQTSPAPSQKPSMAPLTPGALHILQQLAPHLVQQQSVREAAAGRKEVQNIKTSAYRDIQKDRSDQRAKELAEKYWAEQKRQDTTLEAARIRSQRGKGTSSDKSQMARAAQQAGNMALGYQKELDKLVANDPEAESTPGYQALQKVHDDALERAQRWGEAADAAAGIPHNKIQSTKDIDQHLKTPAAIRAYLKSLGGS